MTEYEVNKKISEVILYRLTGAEVSTLEGISRIREEARTAYEVESEPYTDKRSVNNLSKTFPQEFNLDLEFWKEVTSEMADCMERIYSDDPDLPDVNSTNVYINMRHFVNTGTFLKDTS